MYTLTIKIAEIGTLLSNGKKSSVGHMWYSISDGNETLSWGYAPKKSVGIWKGKVVENDDSNYQTTYYISTIVISKTQYDTLKSWYTRDEYMKEHYVDGFYVALWKDCINFTWKALEAIGLNPVAATANGGRHGTPTMRMRFCSRRSIPLPPKTGTKSCPMPETIIRCTARKATIRSAITMMAPGKRRTPWCRMSSGHTRHQPVQPVEQRGLSGGHCPVAGKPRP